MSLDDGISGLIGRIYEGAHDPAVWDVALDGLLERTGSRFTFVSVVDLKRAEFSSARFYGADDARFLNAVRDYDADLWRSDPALAYGLRHPNAGRVSLSKVIPRPDFASHPYVRWLREEMGGGDCVVRYTPPIDDLIFAISLHPPAWRGAHDPGDIGLFNLLFAHFERALRLSARPPSFLNNAEALLLVDRHGTIREMTEAARRLLGERDGLLLAHERMCATRHADTIRLDSLLASALGALRDGGAGGAIAVPRPSGKRDWLVTITPLPNPPSPFEAFRPAALVRIVDSEAAVAADASAAWATLFGFTPAEIRLAAVLLVGEGNLRRAAEQLGIAYATARVQLTSLFDKTGTHSQAQLARLLTRINHEVQKLHLVS